MLGPAVGVIHGRFQPLHTGHMEYLQAGRSRCQFLVVGITNPDPSLTAADPTCPHRSHLRANPFTYYERLMMVRGSLVDVGADPSRFSIVPFPINRPKILRHYAPPKATYYMTIYDDWGRTKERALRARGLEVKVMWDRAASTRKMSGSQVRQLIADGGQWQQHVPRAVREVIETIGVENVRSRIGASDS